MEDARVVRLEIPNSPEFVSIARKTLEAVANTIGLTTSEIEDLELAVGEACANAVKHGEAGDQTVQVFYRVGRNSIEIEVCNKGKAFTPPPCPHIKDLPVGGLGLFIIDQLVDRMSIDCSAGETRLKMVKQIGR